MVNRDARDNVRRKLENDPDRDMSHVPGTYNPGNQAGKPVQGGGLSLALATSDGMSSVQQPVEGITFTLLVHHCLVGDKGLLDAYPRNPSRTRRCPTPC
jgi:hypothetical protein